MSKKTIFVLIFMTIGFFVGICVSMRQYGFQRQYTSCVTSEPATLGAEVAIEYDMLHIGIVVVSFTVALGGLAWYVLRKTNIAPKMDQEID